MHSVWKYETVCFQYGFGTCKDIFGSRFHKLSKMGIPYNSYPKQLHFRVHLKYSVNLNFYFWDRKYYKNSSIWLTPSFPLCGRPHLHTPYNLDGLWLTRLCMSHLRSLRLRDQSGLFSTARTITVVVIRIAVHCCIPAWEALVPTSK